MIPQNAPADRDNPYLQGPALEEVEHESFFLFRLGLDDARRHVPTHLTPLVVAPDTTLFGIGVQRIPRTRFGSATDIGKVYLTFAVEPRHDLGAATPRFCFYVPMFYVDPPAFREELLRVDRVPLFDGSGLRVDVDPVARTIVVEDDAGPICSLRHTTPAPVFRHIGVWTQVRSVFDGVPFVQANYWEGEGYEHTGTAEVGRIHPHRFFGDLPVADLGTRAYHQLFMRHGSQALVHLYTPMPEPPPLAGGR